MAPWQTRSVSFSDENQSAILVQDESEMEKIKVEDIGAMLGKYIFYYFLLIFFGQESTCSKLVGRNSVFCWTMTGIYHDQK